MLDAYLMRAILLVLKVVLAAACVVGATHVRDPAIATLRPWPLLGVLVLTSVVAVLSLGWRHWAKRSFRDRFELAPFVLAVAALSLAIGTEARFQSAKRVVLAAPPSAIERLGRHIVVGYGDAAFVRELVERRAIGGVFLTRRNTANRDAASIAAEIAALQAIRVRQRLPPLWVASDQEGGGVSRLSPPLVRQPPLSAVVRDAPVVEARRAAVAAYADEKGRGLAGLGFNLNFAPVVDLNLGLRNPNDAYTRIAERAISADAAVVAEVASVYCEGLIKHGVHCTLKHFPGLGRVFDDTHHREGILTASAEELERTDWVPFRRLLGRSESLVMVGHVRVPALDPDAPVSTSKRVITGLMRDAWGYRGLVITDDMCMGAIYDGHQGIGRASVAALNAGVDLLLISWDGEQVYPVLADLLRAGNAVDAAALEQSARRVRDVQVKLRPAGAR